MIYAIARWLADTVSNPSHNKDRMRISDALVVVAAAVPFVIHAVFFAAYPLASILNGVLFILSIGFVVGLINVYAGWILAFFLGAFLFIPEMQHGLMMADEFELMRLWRNDGLLEQLIAQLPAMTGAAAVLVMLLLVPAYNHVNRDKASWFFVHLILIASIASIIGVFETADTASRNVLVATIVAPAGMLIVFGFAKPDRGRANCLVSALLLLFTFAIPIIVMGWVLSAIAASLNIFVGFFLFSFIMMGFIPFVEDENTGKQTAKSRKKGNSKGSTVFAAYPAKDKRFFALQNLMGLFLFLGAGTHDFVFVLPMMGLANIITGVLLMKDKNLSDDALRLFVLPLVTFIAYIVFFNILWGLLLLIPLLLAFNPTVLETSIFILICFMVGLVTPLSRRYVAVVLVLIGLSILRGISNDADLLRILGLPAFALGLSRLIFAPIYGWVLWRERRKTDPAALRYFPYEIDEVLNAQGFVPGRNMWLNTLVDARVEKWWRNKRVKRDYEALKLKRAASAMQGITSLADLPRDALVTSDTGAMIKRYVARYKEAMSPIKGIEILGTLIEEMNQKDEGQSRLTANPEQAIYDAVRAIIRAELESSLSLATYERIYEKLRQASEMLGQPINEGTLDDIRRYDLHAYTPLARMLDVLKGGAVDYVSVMPSPEHAIFVELTQLTTDLDDFSARTPKDGEAMQALHKKLSVGLERLQNFVTVKDIEAITSVMLPESDGKTTRSYVKPYATFAAHLHSFLQALPARIALFNAMYTLLDQSDTSNKRDKLEGLLVLVETYQQPTGIDENLTAQWTHDLVSRHQALQEDYRQYHAALPVIDYPTFKTPSAPDLQSMQAHIQAKVDALLHLLEQTRRPYELGIEKGFLSEGDRQIADRLQTVEKVLKDQRGRAVISYRVALEELRDVRREIERAAMLLDPNVRTVWLGDDDRYLVDSTHNALQRLPQKLLLYFSQLDESITAYVGLLDSALLALLREIEIVRDIETIENDFESLIDIRSIRYFSDMIQLIYRDMIRISQRVQQAMANKEFRHSHILTMQEVQYEINKLRNQLDTNYRRDAAEWVEELQRLSIMADLHLRDQEDAEDDARYRNPYQAGGIVEIERQNLFKGRKEIAEEIISSLTVTSSAPTIVIYGPRRTGKSSFLKQLPRLLPRSRFVPVYVNAQSPKVSDKDSRFFYSIADEIYRVLKIEATQDKTLSRPNLKDYEVYPYSILEEWLEDEVSLILNGRKLLITFDEFEYIGKKIENPNEQLTLKVFDTLRSMMEARQYIIFMFVGVDSVESLGRHAPSYFISARAIKLPYLDREQTRELVINPDSSFAEMPSYDEDVVEAIFTMTEGQPFLIQAIGSAIISLANEKDLEHITLEHLEQAIEQNLFDKGTIKFFFDDIDEKAREYEGGIDILRAIQYGANHLPPDVASSPALPVLLHRQSIKKLPDGRYQFALPIIERWFERENIRS